MTKLTQRLALRIGRDFPPGTAEQVCVYLEGLTAGECGGQDPERVKAAVVLFSRGQWERFPDMIEQLEVDWRDVLVAGGLAHED
jgi:hypothetical protein